MSNGKPILIDGIPHIHTLEAAKRLGLTPQRIREFISEARVNAVYLNGYYIPVAELKMLKKRKPGRPTGTTKKMAKK
jgi:hypothetical protein